MTPSESGAAGAKAEDLLEAYTTSTAVEPPAELATLIRARVAAEPPWTGPRRFVASLRALDMRGSWRGFRRSLGTVVDPSARSILLRAQALVVVVAVMATLGLGSVAAVTTAGRIIEVVTGPTPVRPSTPPPATPNRPALVVEDDSAAPRADDRAVEDVSGTARPSREDDEPGTTSPEVRPTPNGNANDKARSAPNGKAKDKARPTPNSKANDKARSAPNAKAKDKARPTPNNKANAKARSAPDARANDKARPTPNSKANDMANAAVPGKADRKARVSGQEPPGKE